MPFYDEAGAVIPGTEEMTPEKLKELTDKAAEADQLKTKITDLEKEIDDVMKGKNPNWKRLRDMNEEERKKLSARETSMLERLEALEDKEKGVNKSIRDNIIKSLAKGDAELAKKIELEYDKYDPNTETITEEQIKEKVMKVYTIATGQPAPKSITGVEFSSQGANGPANNDKKLTPEQGENLDSKLGIKSDADMKKAVEAKEKGNENNPQKGEF